MRGPTPLAMTQTSFTGFHRIHTMDQPTILVAIDFSDTSRKALDAATALAKDMDARLLLVHVLERIPYPAATSGRTMDAVQEVHQEIAMDDAVTLTTEWAEAARKAGVEVETAMEEGATGEIVRELAEEHDAMFVVVGTHGRSGLKAALMGSVAKEILQESERPVLVVPGKGKSD